MNNMGMLACTLIAWAGMFNGAADKTAFGSQDRAPHTLGKTQRGLYSDEEIERLVRKESSEAVEFNSFLLKTVPRGETSSLGEVCVALGLDASRFIDRRSYLSYNVVFLHWQVSPSYDLSVMTIIPETESFFELKRQVYGVRIMKRTKGSF